MSTIPEPSSDLGPVHRIVAEALKALRDFAGPDLDRATGALILCGWPPVRDLSAAEHAAILLALPAVDIGPGSWLSDASLRRHIPDEALGMSPDSAGWTSGSMGTDDVPDGVEGNHVAGRRRTCRHCGADVPVVGGRYVVHKRPNDGGWCRDSGRPVEATN